MSASSTPAPPASSSTDDPVLFTLSGGLATITLNRPDKLNSLNAAMHARLRQLLGQVADDPTVRALLLTGNGRGFCAGQDLNERRQAPDGAPPDLGQTIETTWNPLARALHYLEIPVICAVNGVAAGAGVNLALGCDIVIAARSASFVLTFSRIGLMPDAGGTYFLPRLAGMARAMGLALLGEKLSAVDAAAWGLIWRCVDDGDLQEAAQKIARTLATGPTRGLKHAKRALRRSLHHSFEEQLELERQLQRQCGFSHDYREGVIAFLEKRPPDFKGS
ncbi:MAG: 2-(1,2-epoxy-1,2-dihydrophenyl)acetyl-CoA isomerase [Burkholderiales bacterium]|nr:2-(1,2-epoxy-1,2-dihydrophenyl)acetyl-CoA isomerase [Burkholderiales bacterium]